MLFRVSFFRRGEFSAMAPLAEMEKLENCNYVVDLAKQCDFVVVGMQGNDIRQIFFFMLHSSEISSIKCFCVVVVVFYLQFCFIG